MRKVILQIVRATFLMIVVFSTLLYTANAQQNIVAAKQDTRPEVTQQQYRPANITLFTAAPWNGYNEIQWTAINEQDTRRYIVEYSYDGINYQTAGEMAVSLGTYKLKHYTSRVGSLLYRIRIEKKDDRFHNSAPFLLEGYDQAPAQVYPTFVEGNTINIRMYFPVESIVITSGSGQQVFTKVLGGVTGTHQLVLPSLAKGMYFITFYGNGWKSTGKFIAGR